MNGITFLDAGVLRHRVSIETVTQTPAGLGGSTETWAEWRSIWAHIEPIRADMRERASQTDELVTHRIHMRQPLAITSEMRLRKGARTFSIDAIYDPDEAGCYWVVLAREESQ